MNVGRGVREHSTTYVWPRFYTSANAYVLVKKKLKINKCNDVRLRLQGAIHRAVTEVHIILGAIES